MKNSTEEFLGRQMREDVSIIMNKYADAIDKLVQFGSDLIEWDLVRDGIEKKMAIWCQSYF